MYVFTDAEMTVLLVLLHSLHVVHSNTNGKWTKLNVNNIYPITGRYVIWPQIQQIT